MSNQTRFLRLIGRTGSIVTYHRESGGTACPCLSPEGFRSPQWHADNPGDPLCNEDGLLSPTIVNVPVKAYVQPVQSSRSTRMNSEYGKQMFGTVLTDDHLGIFPLRWSNTDLDFEDWGQAGEDYVIYNDRRFVCVASNLIPDPSNGEDHHWEIALRLVKNERVTD